MVEVIKGNAQVSKFIAVVKFLNPSNGVQQVSTIKEYDFTCNIKVQESDIVIVDTVNGLQLARVVGVKKIANINSQQLKWVVQRVDLAEHQARIEAEMRRNESEKVMALRAKEINKIQQYKALAAEDSVMAQLVAEYQSLDIAFIWDDKQPAAIESDNVRSSLFDMNEPRIDHHEGFKDKE